MLLRYQRVFFASFFRAALTHIAFFACQSANAQPQYQKPSDIPAEAFAALPQVSLVRQSPEGDKVAYMSSIEGRKVMVVQNIDGSNRYIQPPIGEADIFNFVWANNDRLLVMYEMTLIRNEYWSFKNRESRLAAINADGSDFEWIVRASKKKNSAGGRNAKERIPMWQTEVIHLLPDEPNHILLSVDGDFNGQDEIRKIDIRNGRFKELEDGFRGVQHWMSDGSGEPRFGWGVWQEEEIAYWKKPEGGWVQVTNQDWYKNYDFFGLDKTGEYMYLYAPSSSGTQGVYRLNIQTGKISDEVFTRDKVNVDALWRKRHSRNLVGVGFTEDLEEFHYIDRGYAGLHRAMKKALPNYHVQILDFDHSAGEVAASGFQ